MPGLDPRVYIAEHRAKGSIGEAESKVHGMGRMNVAAALSTAKAQKMMRTDAYWAAAAIAGACLLLLLVIFVF